MTKKNCIFCGVQLKASKLALSSSQTQEHVFARWIRDTVSNTQVKMYETVKGSEPRLLRKVSLQTLVNSRVCRECNNGWMEKLETETDPLAERLFRGEDVRDFSATEIATLARWTGKTAAVLSYTTPQQQHVSEHACRSLHPSSPTPPALRFFYASFDGDITLEGGYLQLVYGLEIPIINSAQSSGTRLLICLNNHCLIADFPPIIDGTRYDLTGSIAAKFWPIHQAAGRKDLGISLPAPIHKVLLETANGIQVDFDSSVLHV